MAACGKDTPQTRIDCHLEALNPALTATDDFVDALERHALAHDATNHHFLDSMAMGSYGPDITAAATANRGDGEVGLEKAYGGGAEWSSSTWMLAIKQSTKVSVIEPSLVSASATLSSDQVVLRELAAQQADDAYRFCGYAFPTDACDAEGEEPLDIDPAVAFPSASAA